MSATEVFWIHSQPHRSQHLIDVTCHTVRRRAAARWWYQGSFQGLVPVSAHHHYQRRRRIQNKETGTTIICLQHRAPSAKSHVPLFFKLISTLIFLAKDPCRTESLLQYRTRKNRSADAAIALAGMEAYPLGMRLSPLHRALVFPLPRQVAVDSRVALCQAMIGHHGC